MLAHKAVILTGGEFVEGREDSLLWIARRAKQDRGRSVISLNCSTLISKQNNTFLECVDTQSAKLNVGSWDDEEEIVDR